MNFDQCRKLSPALNRLRRIAGALFVVAALAVSWGPLVAYAGTRPPAQATANSGTVQARDGAVARHGDKPTSGADENNQATFGTVDIGHGIVLHYAEQGTGVPVIFVHGSLSDYSYWRDQVIAFSRHYRAIAYSRRYNFPNHNPAVAGYSAITDADDLASFIETMHLGKVYVVGHSYGALTGLFLAVRHPELVRALALAEPPAISLLRHLPGKDAKAGQAMYADIEQRMVAPMKAQFAKGDSEAGVAVFIDYVFNDPRAWEKMSAQDRAETMKDAHEWDVMMTTGTLFPVIPPQALRDIRLPVLIMSGGKSYPFLALIDRELARLIPNSRSVVFPDAGHQMWMQDPVRCRDDVEAFFRTTAR